ncbi:hypothetical protein A9Q81_21360 [Gammaproteobacteria bacterium 42_54_T18]|nr:hypothetical protein A9Q81_21360 [Gammaproteobacteria bacterium 42_54_T18]
MKNVALTFILLFTSAITYANDWVLETSNDDVNVYSRKWPGDAFREIRGVTTVKASMRQLVSFLQDENINTQWVPYSGGAKVLGRPDQYRTYVHFKMNTKWPFKNRDTVALFTLSQNEHNKNVTIQLESAPDKINMLKGRIRIKEFSGFWELTPLDNTQIHISYQTHLNPEGFLPAWMSNRVAYNSTLVSLSNLKKQIVNYNHAPDRFLFIQE